MLRLSNLTIAYRRHPAVHHAEGAFQTGSMTAIVGPNGAGKSTLLKAVMGLVPVSEGAIELQGIQRSEIAYLPQAAEIDRAFPIDVADFVALGAWRRAGIFGAISGPAMAAVTAAIEAVGLAGLERRAIGSLSGGQFQRALFARMMVQDARLMLLDEPFAAIDTRTTADLMALIHRWHEEGRTVIAVLHDLDLVKAHFPESLLLAREVVAWGETRQVLTEERLRRARFLADGWLEDSAVCERQAA